jgi:hypothetical protein
VVIIQKYISKWMARRAYLKLLLATTFIQYCWMQVCARKKLQRLQQDAKELSIKLGDSIQKGSDLNFGVKFLTVQFYAIEHNSKPNCWIDLKHYQKIQDVVCYVEV